MRRLPADKLRIFFVSVLSALAVEMLMNAFGIRLPGAAG